MIHQLSRSKNDLNRSISVSAKNIAPVSSTKEYNPRKYYFNIINKYKRKTIIPFYIIKKQSIYFNIRRDSIEVEPIFDDSRIYGSSNYRRSFIRQSCKIRGISNIFKVYFE